MEFGRGVASEFITVIGDHRPDVRRYRAEIEQYCQAAYSLYYSTINAIKKNSIDVVYLHNGRGLIRPILNYCVNHQIGLKTFEQRTDLTDYFLFDKALPQDTPYIKEEFKRAWKEQKSDREEVANHWFQKQRFQDKGKHMVNHMYFLKYQKKNNLPEGFDPKKRNIVIFNSTIDEYVTFPKRSLGV